MENDSTLRAKRAVVVERRPLGSLPPLLPTRKFSLKTGELVRAMNPRPAAKPDQVFAYLLWYAERGLRCPTRDQMSADLGHLANPVTVRLALEGRITIEVGGRNFRVIEIDGKRTAEDPSGAAANRRISKAGHEKFKDGKWVKVRTF